MTNKYFAQIETTMLTAQEQLNQLLATTLHAKCISQELVNACDQAIAQQNESLAKELVIDIEFNTGDLWEDVKALRESTMESIDVFDKKLSLLAQFAE